MSINGSADPKDMAQQMNSHYVNVGPNLSHGIISNMEHEINDNTDETCFRFTPVTFEEVEKLLLGLSPSKACRVDGLTARLIKARGSAIVAPLTYVYNLSLQHSKFPNIWKTARVSSLYKEGNPSLPYNYRPISVLPILSKVLERQVHNQVYKYISDTNYLSSQQAGFMQGV